MSWKPREILWLRAALTLPLQERSPAFRDIAGMTGKTVDCVRAYGVILRKQAHEAAREFLAQNPPYRRIMVIGCKPGPKSNAPFYPQERERVSLAQNNPQA